MMPAWLCMDCMAYVELDRHGRCSRCGSDSVDIAVRPEGTVFGVAGGFLDVEILEKLYQES